MNKAGILVDDSNAAADRCRPRWSLVAPAARVPWVEPGSRSRLSAYQTHNGGGQSRRLYGSAFYQTRFFHWPRSRFMLTVRRNELIVLGDSSATGQEMQWEQDWAGARQATLRGLSGSLVVGREGSSVAFVLAPSIPGVPTTPVAGSNTSVNWSGAAPSFSITPSGNVLPVEVRSNAGQITLRATATTALASGANTIPLSEITIATSDINLPAPLIPNTGTGPAVTVVATAFAGLVTQRTANWTLSYANLASRRAGTYTGQVTFTASSP